MKRLIFFVLVAFAFAACEQAPIEEQLAVRQDAPETITVGFEGDDTRIQLNEAQKTVWTKGDQVSVFYRSNANQQWKYDGETGARTANLKRVDAGTATRDMDRVVVVYPYNEDYYINPSTFNVQASLPATQHYLANSYGLDGNIMISSAEYNDVTLKNVCGWLKLQLTGDGEVVKSITFKGNNGEQVAGELYINSAEATAILASDMGNIAEDDGNNATGGAGANLSFDDVVLKEVTLDCGEGVTLGAEATAFYIALPPQTFEEGFTVDIECDGYKPMTLSTTNTLTIERNHIQPMASVEHDASPIVPNNQIWYTSSDGNIVEPKNTDAFGANITSNKYNNGMGVITFDGDVTSIEYYAFDWCDSLTSVNIPDSVTTIGYAAFNYCTSLTSVTIGDSVTSIGNEAFEYCSSLTSVTIPNSVTTIGNCAFYHCYSLTSVTIGNSVTTIGEGAFSDCWSLTSVNIPESVTTIGDAAFAGCSKLREFTGKYAADGGRCLIIDNTIIAYANASGTTYNIPESVTTIGDWAFSGCTSLTSVNIPDSVTEIGDYTFDWCDSLTSVNIPNSVTTIGEGAFRYCDSLTSVNIPDSVTTIGDYAFENCDRLTSVNIPDSVTSIGNEAFASCNRLTSVNIPDSVTTIGNYAFRYCDSLTEFTGKFAEDNGRILVVDGVLTAFAPAGITEYNIPDSVTWIGDFAFDDCDSLTSVNIPDSVTTIGNSAFNNCDSLTSVNIPDSVTTIGKFAFCGCSSLTSVNIGNSITTIGMCAFNNCNSLTSVYCKAATPPSLDGTYGNYVFGYNGSGRKIYVPAGSVNAYKSAEYWSEYASAIVGYDFDNGVVVE